MIQDLKSCIFLCFVWFLNSHSKGLALIKTTKVASIHATAINSYFIVNVFKLKKILFEAKLSPTSTRKVFYP